MSLRADYEFQGLSGLDFPVAGPRGFEPLFFGFLPQKRPEACAPSKEDSTP
jgi:hypothetical protein